MADYEPVLCCAEIAPTDATDTPNDEADYTAFLDFAIDSDTTTPTPADAGKTTQGSDVELSHFIVCRKFAPKVAGGPDNALVYWDGPATCWLAYRSTQGYQYVKAEWQDREKLGEKRVGSNKQWGCYAALGGCGGEIREGLS
ncbi:hypothetical protein LTR17_002069 [Elasticomyces elasticus]|nr:hypothetical protein LTR17_002069 [Elasticomyces elasticus]